MDSALQIEHDVQTYQQNKNNFSDTETVNCCIDNKPTYIFQYLGQF